ncbi:MAG: glycosyl transferase [Armatimonadetes bacterium]|nr:glycosyl transferase [Armatimonadota bacterium]
MIHLCTYFDSRYLQLGLTMYRSIAAHSTEPFCLWVLCLDDAAEKIVSELCLPGVRTISLGQLEEDDDGLAAARDNRGTVEYYWTLSPILPLYIFRNHPEVGALSYVDSDICFFESPSRIFEELGDKSILIDPHDFSEEYARLARFGKYNVGVLAFRADEEGIACLEWWRERCLEWCGLTYEDGKYGDQAYLDEFPNRYNKLVEASVGIRLAPWNALTHTITTCNDGIYAGGHKVVCYHFQSLKFWKRWLVRLSQYKMTGDLKKHIYKPYLRELAATSEYLRSKGLHSEPNSIGFQWRDTRDRFRANRLRYFYNFAIFPPRD